MWADHRFAALKPPIDLVKYGVHIGGNFVDDEIFRNLQIDHAVEGQIVLYEPLCRHS
jgi:hypothetical protein